MGGVIISCDSHENKIGRVMGDKGKRVRWEMKIRERMEDSIYLHEWHVTEFSTHSCVFAYE